MKKHSMLRLMALVLALLTLSVVLLTACGSEETSSAEPTESSEDTSGDTPEEKMIAVPIAVGAKYTVSSDVVKDYPDLSNTELTDGLFAPENCEMTEGRFSGYEVGSEPLVLEVTLGKVYGKVHRFDLQYYTGKDTGVSALKIETSTNGKDWSVPGEFVMPEKKENTAQTATLELPEYINCAYVRVTVTGSGKLVLLSEINVVADYKEGTALPAWPTMVQTAYESDKRTDSELAEMLQKIVTGKPDKTLDHMNIALGAAYKTSREIAKRYPDDASGKLTDGETGEAIDSDSVVGFTGGEEVCIDVTLKEVAEDISGFELHAVANRNLKVLYSPCVTVLVSEDGKNWTEVGKMYAPLPAAMDASFYLELSQTVKAKYVRFKTAATETKYLLLDEVSVYAYRDDPGTSFYPKLRFPEITENEFWASTESDYATEKNLILGLGQQVASFGNASVNNDGNNTAVTSPLMTDGKYSSAVNIHSGGFFKFNGGAGREIYYDLGKVSTLKSFRAGFTLQSDWGVHAPATVDVVVSMNGKNWFKVGEIAIDHSKDPSVTRGELKLTTPVAARFVCFAFTVSTWAGIDELEAIGTKKVDSSVKLADQADLEEYSFQGAPGAGAHWAAPSEDKLGGVHDIILAYHNQAHPRTVRDLLCEAAYLDTEGNITDTMFDGFLFLMSGGFPSTPGGTGGAMNYNKSDMDWLLTSLFTKGQNILALEEAIGQVKDALNLDEDYKVKYYVSVYYPSSTTFEDIDGDGQAENMQTRPGKAKVLKWWIDQFEAKRAEYDFKNIEFCGYYWYNESLSSDHIAITKAVSEHVHSYNSQLFWIPYYSASGIAEWKDFGIDVACLQPNFAFHLEVPNDRIPSAANLAKGYGMCLEIEMAEASVNDVRYRRKYYEYLKQGAKLGYMTDAIHMYYMGMYIHHIAESDKPEVRAIYDNTYKFIKHQFVPAPEKPEDLSFTFGKDIMSMGQMVPNPDSSFEYMLYESPKHGTVTLQSDGSFAYYPNKGFTGEDSFKFCYSEGMDYSEPCEVRVTIK